MAEPPPAVPGRIVRLVLALYPATVRERYGAELADLLAHSPTPVRDVADAAWCGLLDRAGAAAYRATCTSMSRLAAMVVAPLGFSLGFLAVATFVVMGVAAVSGGGGVDQQTVQILVAAGVLPVGLIAGYLGLRTGRRIVPADPGALPPFALAVGTVAVAGIPIFGEFLGERWSGVAAAVACWGLATAALTTGMSRLVGRVPAAVVVGVTAIGAAVILDLACVAYGSVVPAGHAPSPAAIWWYPMAISGIQGRFTVDPRSPAEILTLLPAVLTLCTVYSLSLAFSAARHRHNVLSHQPAGTA